MASWKSLLGVWEINMTPLEKALEELNKKLPQNKKFIAEEKKAPVQDKAVEQLKKIFGMK